MGRQEKRWTDKWIIDISHITYSILPQGQISNIKRRQIHIDGQHILTAGIYIRDRTAVILVTIQNKITKVNIIVLY